SKTAALTLELVEIEVCPLSTVIPMRQRRPNARAGALQERVDTGEQQRPADPFPHVVVDVTGQSGLPQLIRTGRVQRDANKVRRWRGDRPPQHEQPVLPSDQT